MGDPIPKSNPIQQTTRPPQPSKKRILPPPVNSGTSTPTTSGTDSFSSVKELIEMQKKASEDPNNKLNTIRNKFQDISTLKKINIMVELPIGKLFTDVSENLAKKDGLEDLKYNEKEHVFQRNGDTGKYSYMPGAFAYYSGGKITTKSGEVIDRPMSVSYDRGKTWTKVSEEPYYVEDIRALKLVPTRDGKAFRVAETKMEGEAKGGLYFLNYVCKGCDPNGIIYYEGVKRKNGSYLEPPQNYRRGKWEIKDSRVKQPHIIYQLVAKYGLQKTNQHRVFSSPTDDHKYYATKDGNVIIIGKDEQGKKKAWVEAPGKERKIHPFNSLIVKHGLTPKYYTPGGWQYKGYPGTAFIQHDKTIIYQGTYSDKKWEGHTGTWKIKDNGELACLHVPDRYDNVKNKESCNEKYELYPNGYINAPGFKGHMYIRDDGSVVYYHSNGEDIVLEEGNDAGNGIHQMPRDVEKFIKDRQLKPYANGSWKNASGERYDLNFDGELSHYQGGKTYILKDGGWKEKKRKMSLMEALIILPRMNGPIMPFSFK